MITIDNCAHFDEHGRKCILLERNWATDSQPTRCIGCPDTPLPQRRVYTRACSLLLIQITTGRFVTSETRLGLVNQIPEFSIDLEARRVVISGEPDTVTFHADLYNAEDLQREAAKRGLDVLVRDYGWTMYRVSSSKHTSL